ncbi:tetratricopeptide repeat protein [Archangium lansingense]|uniref:tetratricopeptide repeat protein n=1 Tax=Archangium lansingense TaxID=2995310 RepID=UPI003B7E4AF3
MRRYTFPLFACSMLLAAAACTHRPTPAPSRSSASPPSAYGPTTGTGGSSTSGSSDSGPSPGDDSKSPPAPSGPAPLAQTPSLVPSPPSPAAREALQLFQVGCPAEGFDDITCEKAVRQLEAVVREDPRQLDARLALADAVWNQAFRQPAGSAERAQLRQRSLDLYQQLVSQDVPDARPYYELSVLTRDPDTRIRLLRRTLALEPKHPESHADLAWLLLEQGKTDQAVREYLTHLSLNPSRERANALEDIRFASRLGELGHVREAARIYDAIWDATREESRAERCQIFKTVDLDPYERIGARFAKQVRESRAYCSDMPRVERAQELERQGQDEAAVKELERQIQENPVPVEPYLALESIHQKQGRVAEAAAVMTRYFQQEKHPEERCRHFRTLSPETVRAMDPPLVQELDRACRGR